MGWIKNFYWFEWGIFAFESILTVAFVFYYRFVAEKVEFYQNAIGATFGINERKRGELERRRLIAEKNSIIRNLYIFASVVLVFWIGTFINIGYHITYRRQIELVKKDNAILVLQAKLSDKLDEISDLRTVYENRTIVLKQEIREHEEANGINTFEEAIKIPTIAYDLSIIRREEAYLDKLKETEIRITLGRSELIYLHRQVRDDLDLINVINDADIDSLVAKINNVIAEYLPDAGKLIIDVNPESRRPPEQIWQEIQR
ncbi:MAG: hypothetical protein NTX82_07235 [Candidatus Parcubacteria bacterium]|nr:hypothetical protein [Candidatus Parcubacteria bacterium]